ncbi:MAG: T9SS type A sorting domain-containing protein [Paludibacteraceae bacterium]|nr:T9SS type A sorting domain-containing protein [Paludibacteraceae bacterium]
MRRDLFILLFIIASSCVDVMSQVKGNICENDKFVSEVGQEQVASESLKTNIFVYNNQLYITNANENALVEVKNMLGETIMSFRLTSANEKIDLDLKKGFYIVRVDDILQRIIIK